MCFSCPGCTDGGELGVLASLAALVAPGALVAEQACGLGAAGAFEMGRARTYAVCGGGVSSAQPPRASPAMQTRRKERS
jgi:hypothetical protein